MKHPASRTSILLTLGGGAFTELEHRLENQALSTRGAKQCSLVIFDLPGVPNGVCFLSPKENVTDFKDQNTANSRVKIQTLGGCQHAWKALYSPPPSDGLITTVVKTSSSCPTKEKPLPTFFLLRLWDGSLHVSEILCTHCHLYSIVYILTF